MNIIQIFKQFPTQESCVKHLEQLRWGDKPRCAYCNSENTYPLNYKSQYRHHCNTCRKSFSVTVGTIMHDTRLPLQKWFLAISLILNAKKGISSMQLARELEIPQKTAFSLSHRIRKAMKEQDGELLRGIVEMDETYVGGKPRKSSKDDDTQHPRGRGTNKECVVGMIEREGKVKVEHVDKIRLRAKGLKSLVRKYVDTTCATLITDEYKGYMSMHKLIDHLQVNHQREYVSGGAVHTNTIESFWAILKRGILGNFHKVSKKYLTKYIDEFTYRFNNRHNTAAFHGLLSNLLGN